MSEADHTPDQNAPAASTPADAAASTPDQPAPQPPPTEHLTAAEAEAAREVVEAEIVGAAPGSDYDASQITVLEGLEAVRKRPGMYIGSTGERGLHHLVWEIVDNSVDEALAGFADTIDVTLLADGGVRVADNGRGIPTDIHPAEGKSAVELVLTQLHAGGKFGGGGYKVSGGLHGVGSSVVNALSTRLDVEVHQKGHVFRVTFDHGEAVAPLEKMEASDRTGTTITYWADGDIFETTTYDFETIRARFQQMAFLNKGLTDQPRRRAPARDAPRTTPTRSTPRSASRARSPTSTTTAWSTTSRTWSRRRSPSRCTPTSSRSSPRTPSAS